MNTLQMELSLMRHFDFRRKLIVPCVTPLSFLTKFEADLIVLSESGYATCVEIKVSKSDLRNDLKKRHINRIGTFCNIGTWREFYFKSFKYFYYAVPEHLRDEALNQIPEFAGLLIVKKYDVEKVRKAKTLFRHKWSQKEQLYLAKLGAMRIYGLKSKINK